MKISGIEAKVAVVTGAGGFIGSSVARRLQREGASVVAVDIEPAGLEQYAGSIRTMDVDLASAVEVAGLAETVIDDFGRIDLLLNVAGGELKPTRAYPDTHSDPGMHPIETIDDETWLRTININLTSAFLCCRAFVPHMKTQGSGRIVNFASFAARNGSIRVGVHYAAAKGGIIGLTKTLALELAPFNITVNAIAPGFIPHQPPGESERAFVERIPLGHAGSPDEIASAAVVLCSDAGSYTSGLTLDVNGGQYIAP